jgi:uncharacterized surface anchored protein
MIKITIAPILFSLIIVTSTSSIFAEEYDLSDHPVYNWTYNENANISNERYSNPAVSNQYILEYSLSILKVDFDPTRIYYEKPVATCDYCTMEQFSKYPKCN